MFKLQLGNDKLLELNRTNEIFEKFDSKDE